MDTVFATQILRKSVDRASAKLRGLPIWIADRWRETYSSPLGVPSGILGAFLGPVPLDPELKTAVLSAAERTLRHEFKIYGSDWKVSERRAAGVTTPNNAARAHELELQMEPGYRPIDWHADHNSGYHWDPRTWHQNIKKVVPGSDVRSPWELARGHHWHILARAFAYTGDQRFAHEIQNQFYDFSARNPPRFGVNWSSTMDVAIRAANWLVAVDFLKAHRAPLMADFHEHFKRGIFEHSHFIFENLEASASDRANHYLANICGLIFTGAYLPPSEFSTRVLDFAIFELERETRRQFLTDGGSFEGSTSYHRLSAEMVFYSYALLLRRGLRSQLSPDFAHSLKRITDFSEAIRKPDGMAPQIGDNDSGRFLNLSGLGEPQSMNHDHLLAAADAFFSRTNSTANFEYQLMGELVRDEKFPDLVPGTALVPATALVLGTFSDDFERKFNAAGAARQLGCRIVFPGDVNLSELESKAWPEFGLYVSKSKSIFWSVRCDHRRHASMEGHAHNDLFALELQVNGKDLLRDPGSFCYYQDGALRNRYRSIHAHFPSNWMHEFAAESLSRLLFTFPNRLAGDCRHFSARRFVGVCKFAEGDFLISFELVPTGMFIRAVAPRPVKRPNPPSILFSPSYGTTDSTLSYGQENILDLETTP